KIIFSCGEYAPNLFELLGEVTGQINIALQTFHHSFYDNYIPPWSLSLFINLTEEELSVVDCVEHRAIVKKILKQFQTDTLDKCHLFQYGKIHGDINEQNIIVNNSADTISAIIDYEDCHCSYYVFELAITILYAILLNEHKPDYFCYGEQVFKGYTKYIQLNNDEIYALPICIKLHYSH
ncbi:unnamed protein product, partial [Didymodactylos carnosus]